MTELAGSVATLRATSAVLLRCQQWCAGGGCPTEKGADHHCCCTMSLDIFSTSLLT